MTVSTSRRSERRLAIVPASGRASSINRFNVSLSGLSQVKQTSVSVFDSQFPSSHRLLRFKKKKSNPSCCFRRVPTVCRLSSSPFLKAHVCGFAFSQFSENILAVPFAVVVRFFCSSSFADCLPARPRSYGRNIQPVEEHRRIFTPLPLPLAPAIVAGKHRDVAHGCRAPGTSSCLKTAVQIVTINSPSPPLFYETFRHPPVCRNPFSLPRSETERTRRYSTTNRTQRAYFPSESIIDPTTRLPYQDPSPSGSSRNFLSAFPLFFFPPRSRLNESQLRPSLVPCTPQSRFTASRL